MSLSSFEYFRISQSKELRDDNGRTMDVVRIETRTTGIRVDIAPNGRLFIAQFMGGTPYFPAGQIEAWIRDRNEDSFLKELVGE